MSGQDPESAPRLASRDALVAQARQWHENPPEEVASLVRSQYLLDDIDAITSALAEQLPAQYDPRDYAIVSEREIYRRLLSFIPNDGINLEQVSASAEMLRSYADGWVRSTCGDRFIGEVTAAREASKRQFDALRNNGLLGMAALRLAIDAL